MLNYYLIVSRLVLYKKIDLAVKVFNKLKLPLVIIGTGSQKYKHRKNINFLGKVDEIELVKYYKNAKALIMPQEEDFGIVSVEAQSYGVPVIAYKKGGALDTVIDGVTGVFFDEQNIESLTRAIAKFEKISFNRNTLITNAKRFSGEVFRKEFLKLL